MERFPAGQIVWSVAASEPSRSLTPKDGGALLRRLLPHRRGFATEAISDDYGSWSQAPRREAGW